LSTINSIEHIPHARRDACRGSRNSRSASRHGHSPIHSSKRENAFLESKRNPSLSPVMHQMRMSKLESLHGELKKLKPPKFDGEDKIGEYVEAWLLGMRKYSHGGFTFFTNILSCSYIKGVFKL
jgi:hypothetical protein